MNKYKHKLTVERDKAVSKREELIKLGYVVLYYPALWGGNANYENRVWCAIDKDGEVYDYGSIRYLSKELIEEKKKFIVLSIKRK